MMHGDISNEVCDTVAFRCVGTLLKFQEQTTKDKVLNFIWGKEKRAIIDEKILHTMENIYRNTEMCVDLVVFDFEYTDGLKEILENLVPFNRIVLVQKVSQIAIRLLTGDLAYYVDEEERVRTLLNSPYAVPFSELNQAIKFKRRYRN